MVKSTLSLIGLAIFLAVYGLYYFAQIPSQQDCQVQSHKFEKDWGNLKRYSSSNTQLSQLPAHVNEVVFMGDSITDRMNMSLLFPNKSYINRGIAGQTTPQMLVRFRSDVINLHPNVVIILAGTNDLAKLKDYEPIEGILGNTKSMVELARVHNIQVILASVLPVCGKAVKKRSPSDILEVNSRLIDYASQTGAIYLDYFAAVVGNDGLLRPELSKDCLHVNETGYAIMVPLAEAAIQRALQKKDDLDLKGTITKPAFSVY